jgi:hypothetical protein
LVTEFKLGKEGSDEMRLVMGRVKVEVIESMAGSLKMWLKICENKNIT